MSTMSLLKSQDHHGTDSFNVRGLEKEYNSAHLTQNQLQEAFTWTSLLSN